MLMHLVNDMLAEVERLMNEVKGTCDGIAHDLSTPLAHIQILLGRVTERSQGVLDEKSIRMMERARIETDSLLERFRAMLRISEISALNAVPGLPHSTCVPLCTNCRNSTNRSRKTVR
jgi:signal transduction histidine kinase